MANGKYFGDDEYIKNLIFFDKADEGNKSILEQECENYTLLKDENSVYRKRAEKAFELAHEIRKFKIELFWKRGTYYWAYIIGTYAAYFAVLSKVIDGCNKLSLAILFGFSNFTKVVLCIITFLCFFFSLSWVLMNKGSKFWQKNWEAHIDKLENEFSGKLYKTFLNTNNKDDFKPCPLSKEAYDYSVTKITMMGSIILMIVSFALFFFHIALLVIHIMKVYFKVSEISCSIVVITFIVVVLFICLHCFLNKCKGNTDNKEENDNNDKKWFQRSGGK